MLYNPRDGAATPSSPSNSPWVEFADFKIRRKQRSRRNRSSQRQFECGRRRAVVRAFTAAGLYAQGKVSTLLKAAECCGTNENYVVAALVVRAVRDPALELAILTGKVRLFDAAEAMTSLASLMIATESADSATKVAFARAVSPAVLWDDFIVPVLSADTIS